jgi:hypothetical protein
VLSTLQYFRAEYDVLIGATEASDA